LFNEANFHVLLFSSCCSHAQFQFTTINATRTSIRRELFLTHLTHIAITHSTRANTAARTPSSLAETTTSSSTSPSSPHLQARTSLPRIPINQPIKYMIMIERCLILESGKWVAFIRAIIADWTGLDCTFNSISLGSNHRSS
jgi:hypothetical protein